MEADVETLARNAYEFMAARGQDPKRWEAQSEEVKTTYRSLVRSILAGYLVEVLARIGAED